MNDKDRELIVAARAMMWAEASGEVQGEWLRRAERTLNELRQAASRPPVRASSDESDGRPALRVIS